MFNKIDELKSQIDTFRPHDEEKLKIGISDEVTEAFMKRFDELEKRIEDLIPKPTTKTIATRAKKETGV